MLKKFKNTKGGFIFKKINPTFVKEKILIINGVLKGERYERTNVSIRNN
jgi:hypothetical protein